MYYIKIRYVSQAGGRLSIKAAMPTRGHILQPGINNCRQDVRAKNANPCFQGYRPRGFPENSTGKMSDNLRLLIVRLSSSCCLLLFLASPILMFRFLSYLLPNTMPTFAIK
jgi:hypothetical protein